MRSPCPSVPYATNDRAGAARTPLIWPPPGCRPLFSGGDVYGRWVVPRWTLPRQRSVATRRTIEGVPACCTHHRILNVTSLSALTPLPSAPPIRSRLGGHISRDVLGASIHLRGARTPTPRQPREAEQAEQAP